MCLASQDVGKVEEGNIAYFLNGDVQGAW